MVIAIKIIEILVCGKRGGRLRRRASVCLSPPVPLSQFAHYDSGTALRLHPLGAMRGVAPTGLRVSDGRCTQGFRSQARCTPAYSLNAPNGAKN